MGFSFVSGSETMAPHYTCNTTGVTDWSGLDASEFTSDLVRELIGFCQDEAYRRGWNDANNQMIELNDSNLFHASFLCAVPYYAWRINYLFGVYEYERETQTTLDFTKPDLRHEIPYVEQAVDDIKAQFSLPELSSGVPALRRAF